MNLSPITNVFNRVISVLVMAFCFLLFPAFIIFTSLNHLFELRTDNLRQQKLEQMHNKLEQMEKYSDNNRYLHFLFKKIFSEAQKLQDPFPFLQKNFANLKAKYDGQLEFIVWDSAGKVVSHLTDQQGYRYILIKLYGMLRDVAEVLKKDSQASISDLKSIKSNINIARQFLGKIFLQDNLRLPYLDSPEAGPILSDFSSKYSSFWYHIGHNSSFLCFLSEALVKGNHGLFKITKALNSRPDNLISGFALSPELTVPATPVPEIYRPFLTRSLAEFELIADPVFENEQALIMIGLAQPGVRSFCIQPKDSQQWATAKNRDSLFIRIMAAILLFYLAIYYFVRFRQEFVSIKWKLIGLFLFANLAPLSIMGFITNDYLTNKREALTNEAITALSKHLRKFDHNFSAIKNDITTELNRTFDRINTNLSDGLLSDNCIETIRRVAQSADPAEICLVSSASQILFKFSSQDLQYSSKNDFIPPLGAAILKFWNGIILLKNKEDIFSGLLSPESSHIIRRSFIENRQIIDVNLGTMQKPGYWYVFGNSEKYANNYILILTWYNEQLHQQFAHKYFAGLTKGKKDLNFFIRSITGGHSWPAAKHFPPGLAEQMGRAGGFRESLSGKIINDGKTSLFVTLKGRNLESLLLAATYPEKNIDQQIFALRSLIILGGIVSLLLTLIIGRVLAGQFLTPINNLRQGTLAIGARNFNHQIPIVDEDEFGHLNMVFNRVIGGLGELEVAKIVQESLFPGNRFKAGSYCIYGHSVVMTTLGGDYYDCLQINKDNWGIVIGDVAGHGVPAGLMMAMAKAGVLMATDKEKLDPAALTKRLHQVFFAIKNDKLKRMMTLQYFAIQLKDYAFTFANAGHCFPILIKPDEQTAEFIEHIATPLGIGSRARYSNFQFKVMPGEALVLYTDGIAEAKNSQGEEYGFERLRAMLLELYNPDPEIYYRNVFSVYESWSPQPDDDLTLIMITNPR